MLQERGKPHTEKYLALSLIFGVKKSKHLANSQFAVHSSMQLALHEEVRSKFIKLFCREISLHEWWDAPIVEISTLFGETGHMGLRYISHVKQQSNLIRAVTMGVIGSGGIHWAPRRSTNRLDTLFADQGRQEL